MIARRKYAASIKSIFSGLFIALVAAGSASATELENTSGDRTADLYVVSFTAAWCPNCKILDPKVTAALETFEANTIEHIVLDMTDSDTRLTSFDSVDGTVLAGVYGDHLGVTGIAMLTASDSGEKLGCATRLNSTEEIIAMITAAQQQIHDHTALTRPGNLGACPPENEKQAL